MKPVLSLDPVTCEQSTLAMTWFLRSNPSFVAAFGATSVLRVFPSCASLLFLSLLVFSLDASIDHSAELRVLQDLRENSIVSIQPR